MVKWDDKATADLFLSMMSVVCPTMNEAQREAITAKMQNRGYDVVWNGIRYMHLLIFDAFCFFVLRCVRFTSIHCDREPTPFARLIPSLFK